MQVKEFKARKRLSRLLWLGASLLVLVGIGVAVRRELDLTNLVKTPVNPKFGPFDAAIDDGRAFLTWLHIVPGSIYLLLAPFQFMGRLRHRYPNLHRWSGRVAISMGLVTGITAILMSFITPIGGINETLATLLFALLFLFSLLKAYSSILQRKILIHREWMLRAFAIGLAIATVRPIVAMFFAFSNLAPREFFGTAFWLGFTLHLLAAESWIGFTRQYATSRLYPKS